jgi:hypothetical protein
MSAIQEGRPLRFHVTGSVDGDLPAEGNIRHRGAFAALNRCVCLSVLAPASLRANVCLFHQARPHARRWQERRGRSVSPTGQTTSRTKQLVRQISRYGWG